MLTMLCVLISMIEEYNSPVTKSMTVVKKIVFEEGGATGRGSADRILYFTDDLNLALENKL